MLCEKPKCQTRPSIARKTEPFSLHGQCNWFEVFILV